MLTPYFQSKVGLKQMTLVCLLLFFHTLSNAQCNRSNVIKNEITILSQKTGATPNVLTGLNTMCGMTSEIPDPDFVTIINKLKTLTVVELNAFFADFGSAPTSFVEFKDVGLIDIWKGCSSGVITSKKNVSFLKILKQFKLDLTVTGQTFAKKLYEHIQGIGKPGSKSKGAHLGSEVGGIHVRVKNASGVLQNITDMPKNSFGARQLPTGFILEIAQYAKNPNGTVKIPLTPTYQVKSISPDGHTFFPEAMTYDQIIEQCAAAFINPSPVNWFSNSFSDGWEAPSENGMIIRWHTLTTTVDPSSFFPKF
jgi:hypothetical protein